MSGIIRDSPSLAVIMRASLLCGLLLSRASLERAGASRAGIVRASLADWISDWLGIRLLMRACLWDAKVWLAGITRASLLCEPRLLLGRMSLERAGASLVRNSACEA